MTQDEIKQIGELLNLKIGKLDQKIQQLESHMNEQFAALDHKIETTKTEIIKSVADYIDESLMPILDQHIKRLEHLEGHTTHPPGISPES